MNRFKLLAAATIAVAALSFSALPAMAQGPGGGGPGRMGGGQRPDPVSRLNEQLHLSATQQTQIKAIFDNMRTQMQSMRQDPNARTKMQGLFQNAEAQINKVLTPAQQNKLKAAGGLRGMMGRGGGGFRGLDQLGLSAAQKTKADAIQKDMRSQMDAVRKDTKLSETDRRTRMGEIRDSHMKSLMQILTPEQQTKLKAMMSQRGGRPGGGGPGSGRPGGGGGGAH